MTYELNHQFFHSINNELQVYLLGWFYSRGNGRVQLNIADLPILQLIKSSLSYSGPIRSYEKSVELNISSRPFLAQLASLGCVPNKYYDSNFPLYLNQMLSPFMRGVFDSYGRIIISKGKYLNLSITYNERFIGGLREFLWNELRISTKHSYRYEHINTLQMMVTKTGDAVRFLEYVYKDFKQNCRQARKWMKYQDFVGKGV